MYEKGSKLPLAGICTGEANENDVINKVLLEHGIACPYQGFGSHEEAVEPVHRRVVPELHRHRCLVLQLRTNLKMVKTSYLNLTCIKRYEHTVVFTAFTCL